MEEINWVKQGVIIKPNPSLSWCRSHAMIPTPEDLGHGVFKIYFSGRDAQNRSCIGYAVVDVNGSPKVIDFSPSPILVSGDLGCFDDNGVTPSCIVNVDGEKRLYYIGWNPGSTVRVHLFGGLAISRDEGASFERWSRAPIIERCPTDPFLNTAPWVVKGDNDWHMYYVSGTEWVHKDLPRYHIKLARSEDGLHWRRDGHICIDFKDPSENALARPYVIREEDIWKMWFAHKGEAYRLGYAESLDGITWERNDEMAGIGVSKGGFDSEMIEYAAVVRYEGQHFMFYNGNNYGFNGIGLAVEE
jgi:hypothetical protein